MTSRMRENASRGAPGEQSPGATRPGTGAPRISKSWSHGREWHHGTKRREAVYDRLEAGFLADRFGSMPLTPGYLPSTVISRPVLTATSRIRGMAASSAATDTLTSDVCDCS